MNNLIITAIDPSTGTRLIRFHGLSAQRAKFFMNWINRTEPETHPELHELTPITLPPIGEIAVQLFTQLELSELCSEWTTDQIVDKSIEIAQSIVEQIALSEKNAAPKPNIHVTRKHVYEFIDSGVAVGGIEIEGVPQKDIRLRDWVGHTVSVCQNNNTIEIKSLFNDSIGSTICTLTFQP